MGRLLGHELLPAGKQMDQPGEDEEDGFALEAGKDDKEFLLSPASGKACKPLAWAN